jgi:hypothetical protein
MFPPQDEPWRHIGFADCADFLDRTGPNNAAPRAHLLMIRIPKYTLPWLGFDESCTKSFFSK